MKFKKSILSLTTLASIAAPIATVVACGDDDGTTAAPEITLVTDAGKITDKSFNQSAWEATSEFSKAKSKVAAHIEPANVTKIEDGYRTALNNGSKVLVLPGFTHMDHASGKPEINKLFADKKAIGIVVDGWLPTGANANTRLAPIAYKVEQAAFEAGFAAAKYLVDKGDNDPKVGVWQGSNAPGVSNFTIGFLLGVAHYNQTVGHTVDNTKPLVTFAGSNITLNTSFEAGHGKTTANSLVAAGADILLAVAGPQTQDAIEAAKGVTTRDIKVIGVDVDQAAAYSADSARFFTSIQKNIKSTVKETLEKIYSGHEAEVVNHLQVATLDHDGVKISNTHVPTSDTDAAAAITAARDANIVTKAKALNFGGAYPDNIEAILKGSFNASSGYWGTNGVNVAGVNPASMAELGITSVTK